MDSEIGSKVVLINVMIWQNGNITIYNLIGIKNTSCLNTSNRLFFDILAAVLSSTYTS